MNTINLTGCGTALITPFKNGEVDYDAFAALVDRQVEAGIDFLVPLGTTGETPCLEDEERIKVLQIAKAHSQGRPVVAGGGTNSLQHTIRSMKMLEPYGVDLHLDYTRRIYPEDRFAIMLTVTTRDGAPMPQDVLTTLRHAVYGASASDMDASYIQACKAYMKNKYAVQMQEPEYWLHAVAMRYLDGKDYTTGCATKVDAVSVEDIRKILRLLDKGSCIEYITNRK